MIMCGITLKAATTTQTRTTSCPRGGTATQKITTDDDSGKVLTIESTNCAGVAKTTTFSYGGQTISTLNPMVVVRLLKQGRILKYHYTQL
jgi:hypothetical protein